MPSTAADKKVSSLKRRPAASERAQLRHAQLREDVFGEPLPRKFMKKKPASTPKPASEPLDHDLAVASPLTRAIFAQDALVVALDEDGTTTTKILGKQIWLLEGSFTASQLTQWVDGIKRGHCTTINANLMVMSIDAVKWPEMHYYFPRGSSLRILTQREHLQFNLALNAIRDGNVIQGHLLLLLGGILPDQPPPSDRAADTNTMVVTEE